MSGILKEFVVACCLVVGVKTFTSDIDGRYLEILNVSRESTRQTIIVYNDYVPVEDRLECVPTGNVVLMLRCNGVPQLPGGADETSCPSTRAERRPGSFKCQNGKEIWDLWRCDGYYHCEDGSDETNCEGYGSRPPEDLFYLCNGVVECRGGWDEVNCPPEYTPDAELIPPSFTCPDKGDSPRLTVRFKCDGQKDCEDGSDEVNCAKMFRCKNKRKTVLPADDYCDGLAFCGSRQEKPSCILVNGPSNHVLRNVSQSVRRSFNNTDTEIYEYVVDEGSSSEEIDSYTITYVDHGNTQPEQTDPNLQYTNHSKEHSNPQPEQTDPNLQYTTPPKEHSTPHSQQKELGRENSTQQTEQTVPTKTPQTSTNPILEQSKKESTDSTAYQLQEDININNTDSRLECSSSYSEPTPIEKSTSPENPPQHDDNANENNNNDNGNYEDSSGNNNSDDDDDDDYDGDSRNRNNINTFLEESGNDNDNKHNTITSYNNNGGGPSAVHLHQEVYVVSLLVLLLTT